MKEIFSFLRKHGITTKRMVVISVFSFVLALLSLEPPELLKHATAAIVETDMGLLKSALIFSIVVGITFVVVSYFNNLYVTKTQNYYEQQLSKSMIEKLLDTKMSVLDKRQFGDISTVIITSVESFVRSAVSAMRMFSLGTFALVLTFVYMIYTEWRLALCVLVYNILIRFFSVFAERKIKKNTKEVTASLKQSGNFLTSLLTNMLTVRVYSKKDFLMSKLQKNEKNVMNKRWKSFVWSNGFQDSIWAFSQLAEFIIVYGVGALLIINGTTDISVLLSFVFASDMFTIGLNNISIFIQERAEASAYMETIDSILMETQLEEKGSAHISLQNEFPIVFDHVSFGYDDRMILDDVSFTIQPREKVLLQGPNGEGKSTILKLISGLYRPNSGKIYYGKQCAEDCSISELSREYSYISQHSNMIEGDVLSNLALSHELDSQLAIGTLASLNLVYAKNTNPMNLSMGEQQRLNIGRSLYRKTPPIVMGDEIFSNVDSENRQSILDSIESKFKDSTVILISHEPIDLQFDRVLTVSGGKVKEEKL